MRFGHNINFYAHICSFILFLSMVSLKVFAAFASYLVWDSFSEVS